MKGRFFQEEEPPFFDLWALACRESEAKETKNHPLCGWKAKG